MTRDKAPADGGKLPRTTNGTPSYSLACARIQEKLDEMLFGWQDEYGLSALEVYDALTATGRHWLSEAVRDQQSRSAKRPGVTP